MITDDEKIIIAPKGTKSFERPFYKAVCPWEEYNYVAEPSIVDPEARHTSLHIAMVDKEGNVLGLLHRVEKVKP